MAANEVDIVGIVLYMLFLLLVCWRVKPFFVEERLSSTDKIKLGFHTCLLGSSLLELVHYAIALARPDSVLSGYACHLVALWLSLVAFSLVIVLWSNTLTPPTRRPAVGATAPDAREPRRRCGSLSLSGTAKFVGAIDAAVAITTVVVLWTGVAPVYSRPYLILVVAHSATLFLLASWLVLYGVRLQRRVMGHPRWEPLDRRQRLKILCRINGVLVVCAVCFLLRVAVLSSALFVRSRRRAGDMNRLLFEFLSKWVSGLVPGVALLHIMCKTKKAGDDKRKQQMRMNAVVDDSQPLREPLLSSSGGEGTLYGNINRQEQGLAEQNSSSGRGGGRGVLSSKIGRQGGVGKGAGRGGDGSAAGGQGQVGGGGVGSAHDSFVYHVVRSQQERTETTI